MNPQNPNISFSLRFIRDLKAVRNWLEENAAQGKGVQFVLELDEFISHKIAPYPTHFMEWPLKITPQKLYRKAMFKKKYVLVFKYIGNSLEFILIYHQKRNPASLKL